VSSGACKQCRKVLTSNDGGVCDICHYERGQVKKVELPEGWLKTAMEKSKSKPPLGIKPRMLWLQSRRDEIYNALFRYFAVDKPIPVEWIEEILEIEKSIQKDKVNT
jgi:hypothetical protein